MNHRTFLYSTLLAGILATPAGFAAAPMEAQRTLDEAIGALQAAREELALAQSGTEEEKSRLREDLSRAHRALREVSREVARAHRELARADGRFADRLRMVNFGDRAVIGVLLGEADANGVRLAGVSPDGPAERAGLRSGDVLVSIRDVDLTGKPAREAREVLFGVMEEVEDGEEVAVGVMRKGQRWDFTVKAELREPASWQSLLRLPSPPPGAPLPPDALPYIVLDRIDIPEFDAELLEQKIGEIEDQLQRFEYSFTDEDGKTVEFAREFRIDGDEMSTLADHALSQAHTWFGLPYTRGLQLAPVNPALGKYFKVERGVLVIRAGEDNAYGLESGDVILSVAGNDVDQPGDLLRALRDAKPGSEVELEIKRNQRDRTLKAKLPEKRLGARGFGIAAPSAVPGPEAPAEPIED